MLIKTETFFTPPTDDISWVNRTKVLKENKNDSWQDPKGFSYILHYKWTWKLQTNFKNYNNLYLILVWLIQYKSNL